MGAITENGMVCTQSITRDDINTYAQMSGDRNPIHLGPDAIAHGALVLGKVSAAVWEAYGDGTLAKGIERLNLHRPIKPGDDFNVFVGYPDPIDSSKIGEQRIVVRVTKWSKERERLIADGSIVIIPPKVGNGIIQQHLQLNGGGA